MSALAKAVASFSPHEGLASMLLPHVDGTTDGSHDFSHLARVWRNAQAIALGERCDQTILAAAVMLHDCVLVEKTSPLRSKASRLAADKAKSLLTGIGWHGDPAHAVAHAVEAHSFSAGVEPETMEAMVLQDADRLDAIGAIGIARLFYVSGRMGRPLYDAADPTAAKRPLDDVAFSADHFQAKLLTLKDGFRTKTGRAMAGRRHDLTARYLDNLFSEIDGAA